jgi:hypothetical protein
VCQHVAALGGATRTMGTTVVILDPSLLHARNPEPRISSEQIAIETVNCSELQSNATPGGPEGDLRADKSRPHINLQLAVLYYSMFLLGFQDGTLGPLLPVIQRVYHVSFCRCHSHT